MERTGEGWRGQERVGEDSRGLERTGMCFKRREWVVKAGEDLKVRSVLERTEVDSKGQD